MATKDKSRRLGRHEAANRVSRSPHNPPSSLPSVQGKNPSSEVSEYDPDNVYIPAFRSLDSPEPDDLGFTVYVRQMSAEYNDCVRKLTAALNEIRRLKRRDARRYAKYQRRQPVPRPGKRLNEGELFDPSNHDASNRSPRESGIDQDYTGDEPYTQQNDIAHLSPQDDRAYFQRNTKAELPVEHDELDSKQGNATSSPSQSNKPGAKQGNVISLFENDKPESKQGNATSSPTQSDKPGAKQGNAICLSSENDKPESKQENVRSLPIQNDGPDVKPARIEVTFRLITSVVKDDESKVYEIISPRGSMIQQAVHDLDAMFKQGMRRLQENFPEKIRGTDGRWEEYALRTKGCIMRLTRNMGTVFAIEDKELVTCRNCFNMQIPCMRHDVVLGLYVVPLPAKLREGVGQGAKEYYVYPESNASRKVEKSGAIWA